MHAILLPPRKRLRKTAAFEFTVRACALSNVPTPLARLHKSNTASQVDLAEGKKSASNINEAHGGARNSGNAGDFNRPSTRAVGMKKESNNALSVCRSAESQESCLLESSGGQQANIDVGFENPKQGPGDNVCNICRKALSSKQSVHRHVMLIHRKQKFPCDICEKKFSSKHSLERHVGTVHLQLRPFPCDDPNCGKWFGQREVAKTHYKKVHGEARLSDPAGERLLAVAHSKSTTTS